MAFFDWNMDGKKDWQDSFFFFFFFKECMEKENDESIFASDDDFDENDNDFDEEY